MLFLLTFLVVGNCAANASPVVIILLLDDGHDSVLAFHAFALDVELYKLKPLLLISPTIRNYRLCQHGNLLQESFSCSFHYFLSIGAASSVIFGASIMISSCTAPIIRAPVFTNLHGSWLNAFAVMSAAVP